MNGKWWDEYSSCNKSLISSGEISHQNKDRTRKGALPRKGLPGAVSKEEKEGSIKGE